MQSKVKKTPKIYSSGSYYFYPQKTLIDKIKFGADYLSKKRELKIKISGLICEILLWWLKNSDDGKEVLAEFEKVQAKTVSGEAEKTNE